MVKTVMSLYSRPSALTQRNAASLSLFPRSRGYLGVFAYCFRENFFTAAGSPTVISPRPVS